jgi:hypothetical protein
MNTALQPTRMVNLSQHDGGPTLAHKAGAFMVLTAASAAFVVMVLWPVVTRFV